ncbi:hypothetical protein CVT24_012759 [Panaeolus cyanescens]|uniref:Uncharacterized protein n=1 Tax=Panaeolus cyanescens TaxID=181874 RepID=A0A409YJG6_9AGAR|nr:hypothetical protein CVT24_012759 [Panaeolus cyanescens]
MPYYHNTENPGSTGQHVRGPRLSHGAAHRRNQREAESLRRQYIPSLSDWNSHSEDESEDHDLYESQEFYRQSRLSSGSVPVAPTPRVASGIPPAHSLPDSNRQSAISTFPGNQYERGYQDETRSLRVESLGHSNSHHDDAEISRRSWQRSEARRNGASDIHNHSFSAASGPTSLSSQRDMPAFIPESPTQPALADCRITTFQSIDSYLAGISEESAKSIVASASLYNRVLVTHAVYSSVNPDHRHLALQGFVRTGCAFIDEQGDRIQCGCVLVTRDREDGGSHSMNEVHLDPDSDLDVAQSVDVVEDEAVWEQESTVDTVDSEMARNWTEEVSDVAAVLPFLSLETQPASQPSSAGEVVNTEDDIARSETQFVELRIDDSDRGEVPVGNDLEDDAQSTAATVTENPVINPETDDALTERSLESKEPIPRPGFFKDHFITPLLGVLIFIALIAFTISFVNLYGAYSHLAHMSHMDVHLAPDAHIPNPPLHVVANTHSTSASSSSIQDAAQPHETSQATFDAFSGTDEPLPGAKTQNFDDGPLPGVKTRNFDVTVKYPVVDSTQGVQIVVVFSTEGFARVEVATYDLM